MKEKGIQQYVRERLRLHQLESATWVNQSEVQLRRQKRRGRLLWKMAGGGGSMRNEEGRAMCVKRGRGTNGRPHHGTRRGATATQVHGLSLDLSFHFHCHCHCHSARPSRAPLKSTAYSSLLTTLADNTFVQQI